MSNIKINVFFKLFPYSIGYFGAALFKTMFKKKLILAFEFGFLKLYFFRILEHCVFTAESKAMKATTALLQTSDAATDQDIFWINMRLL